MRDLALQAAQALGATSPNDALLEAQVSPPVRAGEPAREVQDDELDVLCAQPLQESRLRTLTSRLTEKAWRYDARSSQLARVQEARIALLKETEPIAETVIDEAHDGSGEHEAYLVEQLSKMTPPSKEQLRALCVQLQQGDASLDKAKTCAHSDVIDAVLQELVAALNDTTSDSVSTTLQQLLALLAVTQDVKLAPTVLHQLLLHQTVSMPSAAFDLARALSREQPLTHVPLRHVLHPRVVHVPALQHGDIDGSFPTDTALLGTLSVRDFAVAEGYLYCACSQSWLLKIGTGTEGTQAGHVYDRLRLPMVPHNVTYCRGKLYLSLTRRMDRLLVLDAATLQQLPSVQLGVFSVNRAPLALGGTLTSHGGRLYLVCIEGEADEVVLHNDTSQTEFDHHVVVYEFDPERLVRRREKRLLRMHDYIEGVVEASVRSKQSATQLAHVALTVQQLTGGLHCFATCLEVAMDAHSDVALAVDALTHPALERQDGTYGNSSLAAQQHRVAPFGQGLDQSIHVDLSGIPGERPGMSRVLAAHDALPDEQQYGYAPLVSRRSLGSLSRPVTPVRLAHFDGTTWAVTLGETNYEELVLPDRAGDANAKEQVRCTEGWWSRGASCCAREGDTLWLNMGAEFVACRVETLHLVGQEVEAETETNDDSAAALARVLAQSLQTRLCLEDIEHVEDAFGVLQQSLQRMVQRLGYIEDRQKRRGLRRAINRRRRWVEQAEKLQVSPLAPGTGAYPLALHLTETTLASAVALLDSGVASPAVRRYVSCLLELHVLILLQRDDGLANLDMALLRRMAIHLPQLQSLLPAAKTVQLPHLPYLLETLSSEQLWSLFVSRSGTLTSVLQAPQSADSEPVAQLLSRLALQARSSADMTRLVRRLCALPSDTILAQHTAALRAVPVLMAAVAALPRDTVPRDVPCTGDTTRGTTGDTTRDTADGGDTTVDSDATTTSEARGDIETSVLRACAALLRRLAGEMGDLRDPTLRKSDRRQLRAVMRESRKCAVVETPHPYTGGTPALNRRIRVPGARALLIHFDAQSQLQSHEDVLAINGGPSGPDGDSAVLMHIGGGHDFPRTLAVRGDSVQFVFNARSRARDEEPHRWGFKCTVSGVFHWHVHSALNAQLSVAHTVASLLRVHQLSDRERHFLRRGLLSDEVRAEHVLNRLEGTSTNVDSRLRSLRELLRELLQERRGLLHAAYAEAPEGPISMMLRRRPAHEQEAWQTATLKVFAASVWLLGIVPSSDPAWKQQALRAARAAKQTQGFMMRRVQLQRSVQEWLRADAVPSVDELRAQLLGDDARHLAQLRRVCLLCGVPFRADDVPHTLLSLQQHLVQRQREQQQQTEQQEDSAYLEAARHVSSLAEALLLFRPAHEARISSDLPRAAAFSFNDEDDSDEEAPRLTRALSTPETGARSGGLQRQRTQDDADVDDLRTWMAQMRRWHQHGGHRHSHRRNEVAEASDDDASEQGDSEDQHHNSGTDTDGDTDGVTSLMSLVTSGKTADQILRRARDRAAMLREQQRSLDTLRQCLRRARCGSTVFVLLDALTPERQAAWAWQPAGDGCLARSVRVTQRLLLRTLCGLLRRACPSLPVLRLRLVQSLVLFRVKDVKVVQALMRALSVALGAPDVEVDSDGAELRRIAVYADTDGVELLNYGNDDDTPLSAVSKEADVKDMSGVDVEQPVRPSVRPQRVRQLPPRVKQRTEEFSRATEEATLTTLKKFTLEGMASGRTGSADAVLRRLLPLVPLRPALLPLLLLQDLRRVPLRRRVELLHLTSDLAALSWHTPTGTPATSQTSQTATSQTSQTATSQAKGGDRPQEKPSVPRADMRSTALRVLRALVTSVTPEQLEDTGGQAFVTDLVSRLREILALLRADASDEESGTAVVPQHRMDACASDGECHIVWHTNEELPHRTPAVDEATLAAVVQTLGDLLQEPEEVEEDSADDLYKGTDLPVEQWRVYTPDRQEDQPADDSSSRDSSEASNEASNNEGSLQASDEGTRQSSSDQEVRAFPSEATVQLQVRTGHALCVGIGAGDSLPKDGTRVQAHNNFPSIVANVSARHGRFYYEVLLESDGLLQLGFCLPRRFSPNESGNGCGDDEHSWGYDGFRGLLWHGSSSRAYARCDDDGSNGQSRSHDEAERNSGLFRRRFGRRQLLQQRAQLRRGPPVRRWQVGDRIGCAVDMCDGDGGVRLSWYRNGTLVDEPVVLSETAATEARARGLAPCVSVSRGQQAQVVLSAAHIRHRPRGYLPLEGDLVKAMEADAAVPKWQRTWQQRLRADVEQHGVCLLLSCAAPSVALAALRALRLSENETVSRMTLTLASVHTVNCMVGSNSEMAGLSPQPAPPAKQPSLSVASEYVAVLRAMLNTSDWRSLLLAALCPAESRSPSDHKEDPKEDQKEDQTGDYKEDTENEEGLVAAAVLGGWVPVASHGAPVLVGDDKDKGVIVAHDDATGDVRVHVFGSEESSSSLSPVDHEVACHVRDLTFESTAPLHAGDFTVAQVARVADTLLPLAEGACNLQREFALEALTYWTPFLSHEHRVRTSCLLSRLLRLAYAEHGDAAFDDAGDGDCGGDEEEHGCGSGRAASHWHLSLAVARVLHLSTGHVGTAAGSSDSTGHVGSGHVSVPRLQWTLPPPTHVSMLHRDKLLPQWRCMVDENPDVAAKKEVMERYQFNYVRGAFEDDDDDERSAQAHVLPPPNRMVKFWERNVIPRLQQYVRGTLKEYEMVDFFMQLRMPLYAGNPDAAVQIAYTICANRIPDGVHFPDKSRDWSRLMLDDVRVGQLLRPTPEAAAQLSVSAAARYVNRVGRAVALHKQSQCVLLQFPRAPSDRDESDGAGVLGGGNSGHCEFVFWWFPVDYVTQVLPESVSLTVHGIAADAAAAELQESYTCADARQKLDRVAARNCRRLLRRLSLDVLPDTADVEQLRAALATRNVPLVMRTLERVARADSSQEPSHVLLSLLNDLLGDSAAYLDRYTCVRSNEECDAAARHLVKCIEAPGASALTLQFDNAARVPPGGAVAVFADALCRTPPLRVLAGGRNGLRAPLPPTVLPGVSRVYIREIERDATQALPMFGDGDEGCTFRARVIPTPPQASVAFFLMALLADGDARVRVAPLALVRTVLRSAVLEKMPPSPLKRRLLRQVAQLLERHDKDVDDDNADNLEVLEQLRQVLQDEMRQIYTREMAQEDDSATASDYLQQLVELSVVLQRHGLAHTPLPSLRALRSVGADVDLPLASTCVEKEEDTGPAIPEMEHWACGVCTYHNALGLEQCEMCMTPRPPMSELLAAWEAQHRPAESTADEAAEQEDVMSQTLQTFLLADALLRGMSRFLHGAVAAVPDLPPVSNSTSRDSHDRGPGDQPGDHPGDHSALSPMPLVRHVSTASALDEGADAHLRKLQRNNAMRYVARWAAYRVAKDSPTRRLLILRNLPAMSTDHEALDLPTLQAPVQKLVSALLSQWCNTLSLPAPVLSDVVLFRDPCRSTATTRQGAPSHVPRTVDYVDLAPESTGRRSREDGLDDRGALFAIGTACGRHPWHNPMSERRLVTVRMSTVQDDSMPPASVVDRKCVRCVTNNASDQWIEIDLGECYTVAPSHYAIMHYSTWDTECLRRWRFEAWSDEHARWLLLREHDDDGTIEGRGTVGVFELPLGAAESDAKQGDQLKSFRRFRVRQTGINSNGNLYLACSAFELYGRLRYTGATPQLEEGEHALRADELPLRRFDAAHRAQQRQEAQRRQSDLCAVVQLRNLSAQQVRQLCLAEQDNTDKAVGATAGGVPLLATVPRVSPVVPARVGDDWLDTAAVDTSGTVTDTSSGGGTEEDGVSAEWRHVQHRACVAWYATYLERPLKAMLMRRFLREGHCLQLDSLIASMPAPLATAVKGCESTVDAVTGAVLRFLVKPEMFNLSTVLQWLESLGLATLTLRPRVFVADELRLEDANEEITPSEMCALRILSGLMRSPKSLAALVQFAQAQARPAQIVDTLLLTPSHILPHRECKFDDPSMDLGVDRHAVTCFGLGVVQALNAAVLHALPLLSLRPQVAGTAVVTSSGSETPAASHESHESEVSAPAATAAEAKVRLTDASTHMLHFSAMARRVRRVRRLLFSSVKFGFVRQVLGATACTGDRPKLRITRWTDESMLSLAAKQLLPLPRRSLRPLPPSGAEPHIAFEAVYVGDDVAGEAGPYRQFFSDVSRELRGEADVDASGSVSEEEAQEAPATAPPSSQPSVPSSSVSAEAAAALAEEDKETPRVLVPVPNAVAGVGEARDNLLPNPSASDDASLKKLEALGVLMGTCVRTGVRLALELPALFWKKLVGDVPTRDDLEYVDRPMAQLLRLVEHSSRAVFEEELAPLLRRWRVTRSDGSELLLRPEEKVGFGMRHEYVRAALRARLDEDRVQMAALRRGLARVVPLPLLYLLSWQELRRLVCGEAHIDVALLRRHTHYAAPLSPDAPLVQTFWQCVSSLSQAQLRAFVRFVWAQERLPADDAEFVASRTRFLVKPATTGGDPDLQLPRADTCFGNIELPQYTSLETMRQRLLFAMTHAVTMNADVHAQVDEEPDVAEWLNT